MLSAVRAMAHRVAQDLAHMEPPAARRRRRRSEEQDRLLADVLERALEAGNEAVRARARAARGAARGGRGRRRRLRPDGDRGRHDRRAARRRDAPELEHHTAPARATCTCPSTSRAATATARTSPSPATSLDTPARSCRGSRRSATRCSSSATRDAARCTSTPTSPTARSQIFDRRRARCRGSTSPTCASRWPSAPRGWRAATRRPGAGTLRRRGRSRAATGSSAMYRELGAYVVDGGADDEPVDLRHPGRHPRGAGADEVIVLPNSPNVIMAAERAAELSEKPAPRGADARAAGRPGRAARVRPAASAEDNAARGGRGGGRARHRRRRAGRARRRVRAASARATRSATRARSWSPGASPRGRSRERARDAGEGAELVTCIAGEGAPLGEDEVAALVPDGLELDYHEGGQPALVVAARGRVGLPRPRIIGRIATASHRRRAQLDARSDAPRAERSAPVAARGREIECPEAAAGGRRGARPRDRRRPARALPARARGPPRDAPSPRSASGENATVVAEVRSISGRAACAGAAHDRRGAVVGRDRAR